MVTDEDGKQYAAPDSVASWANSAGTNVAAEGLRCKLNRVFDLPYIVDNPTSDGLGEIIKRSKPAST